MVDKVKSALYRDGRIVVSMESGVEIRFPIAGNPRLSKGTPEQLNNIEVSPFGLHWPGLDEDLSFRGLLEGDCGQNGSCRPRRNRGDASIQRNRSRAGSNADTSTTRKRVSCCASTDVPTRLRVVLVSHLSDS